MHFHHLSLRSFLLLTTITSIAIACSSSEPSSSASGSSSPTNPNEPVGASNGSPGNTTPGAPSSPSSNAPSCNSEADCPYWYCECEKGPPVNTRHCTNNRCEDAPTACPTSCKSFKTCWTGKAGGGWDGGSNAGPDDCNPPPVTTDGGAGAGCGDQTSYTDVGKACAGNANCQSGQCWGVNPSFLCTKRCKNAQECPLNWKCVSNGSFDICMQGGIGATGPVSTNASCAQVTFTDLGGACTQPTHCQSYICLGQTYCSKRCETSSDCPSGWSCTSGTSFKYCTK